MGDKRDIKIMTGSEGRDMFNHAFKVELYKRWAKNYNNLGKISDEQLESLTSMLNSEDRENCTIAIMAIKHLAK